MSSDTRTSSLRSSNLRVTLVTLYQGPQASGDSILAASLRPPCGLLAAECRVARSPVGDQLSPNGPKMTQHDPKLPKTNPTWPKIYPTWLKIAQTWPKSARMTKKRSSLSHHNQDAFVTPFRHHFGSTWAPFWSKVPSKMHVKTIKKRAGITKRKKRPQ